VLQVATSHTPQVASWPQWRTRVPTMISDYGLRIKYGARLESMLERVHLLRPEPSSFLRPG